MKEIMCSYRDAGKLPKDKDLIKGKGLQTELLILIRTLYGCSLIENADGTGSSLLDNAGAYYPELILLDNHYLQSMHCL